MVSVGQHCPTVSPRWEPPPQAPPPHGVPIAPLGLSLHRALPQLLHAPHPHTLPPKASSPPSRQGALPAARQRVHERLPPHHGVTSGGANFPFRPPRCRQLPLPPLPPNPGNARALGPLPVRAGGGRLKKRPGPGAEPRLPPAGGGIPASRYPDPPPVPLSREQARGPGSPACGSAACPWSRTAEPHSAPLVPPSPGPGPFLCSGLRPFPPSVPRCWQLRARGLAGALRFPQLSFVPKGNPHPRAEAAPLCSLRTLPRPQMTARTR